MRVDGAWRIRAGVQAAMTALEAGGHTALFVGGCVRNAVIGAPVDDIDLATDALPEQVIALVEAAGFRVVPTGIDHGTVTVVAEGTPLEVTTFRSDIETDGRRAIVRFADTPDADARRRDFTMNALYATRHGEVIDPLGGLPDLRARHVRFIGDARARIVEDYLRILRYFRFHAWYGDAQAGVDAEALAACAALADGLDGLSRERIWAEMRKLLSAPDPAPSIAAMGQSGVLMRVVPGAAWETLAPLVHLEGAIGAAPAPLRRLASLGGETGDLRLSRAEAKALETLRNGLAADAGAAELAWRHGADAARSIELLRAAAFSAPLAADLDAKIARGVAATFPVSGADLKPALDGPAIGRRLKALEDRWIASDFRLTKDDLLQ